MAKNWKIRSAKSADLNFIYSTWLNSYCVDSAVGKSVRKSLFHREYARVVDRILSDAATAIACKLDDDLTIYGYLVFEPHVLHYCFIKEPFRFTGIAKDLVKNAMSIQHNLTYTHHTNHLKPIVEKYPLLTYNPFLLFKGHEEK